MEIIPHPKDIEITDVSELGLLAGSWWRVTPPVGTAVIRPRPPHNHPRLNHVVPVVPALAWDGSESPGPALSTCSLLTGLLDQ